MIDIPSLTRELIEKYGTNNPFELCDYLDIATVFVALPPNINGFFQTIDGHKFIYLNNTLDKNKVDFCCAHELGHALMHNKMNTIFLSTNTYFSKEKLETQADRFAAFLLFDDADVLYDKFGITTQSEICNFYGIDDKTAKLRYE